MSWALWAFAAMFALVLWNELHHLLQRRRDRVDPRSSQFLHWEE